MYNLFKALTMSIKTMLNSIKISYCKVKMLSHSEWDAMCAGIDAAYESGAEVTIALDPAETPKITILFKKEKGNTEWI